jgi:ketosteroid isomerase-like protein
MALEQDNGAIVRRLCERVWNDGDLSAIEDLVDDDVTNFGVRRPGGHAAMRHIVTAWRTAFPGLRHDIQEEIVHRDKVVHRVMLRGTHPASSRRESARPGSWGRCRPPAGPFEAGQIHITRVAGGKIVEHAASRNDLLLLNQLGLVSGTQPITEATWRKPVTPGAAPGR